MAKVNFTKVEAALDQALQKLFIDQLFELATLTNGVQNSETTLSSKAVEEIITRFQKELKKIKIQDPKLYEKLNLSIEDEQRFALSSQDFLQADWLGLKALKIRVDELKHELYGQEILDTVDEKQVTKERHRHVNKRFNVREGWLPLH